MTITRITIRCALCGSDQLHWTAWVMANTDEVVGDDSPTNDTWCPVCEQFDGGYIEDAGRGFTLYREGEWSGEFQTFDDALKEARQSTREYIIEPSGR